MGSWGLDSAIEYLESRGYTLVPGEVLPGYSIPSTYLVTSDRRVSFPLTVTMRPEEVIRQAALNQWHEDNPDDWLL